VIVVDTGVLLAAVSSTDRHHQSSAQLLAQNAGNLVTPANVIAESAWMIESVVGPTAEAAFVASAANGELGVEGLVADDNRRCAELIDRYADLGLGLVDASVVAVAERLSGQFWRRSIEGTSPSSAPGTTRASNSCHRLPPIPGFERLRTASTPGHLTPGRGATWADSSPERSP
jgi:uncharacterized protein